VTGKLQKGDALVIVDVQNDFCPGGALPVARGDEVVPVLNRLVSDAAGAGAPVFASRDWHPADHGSFREQGGIWPVHCVRETEGAQFHRDLKLPPDAVIISKATEGAKDAYSAFEGTDLTERLKKSGARRLWVGGLALDYCVRATVLDGIRNGFEVHVILPATRAVNVKADDGDRALEEMRRSGAIIEFE